MPGNRLLLFAALALAAIGTAGAFAVGAPEASTALSSSGHTATTVDFLDDELPDQYVPEDVPTTTTSTAVPTTTTVAPTSTTSVTPTTVAPPTTTTTIPNTATIRVKNNFTSTVKISVNDVTSHEWTLEPGEEAGPWTLETATDHGDGLTVMAVDSQCGYGDGEDYFLAGHSYVLTAETGSQTCGDVPGPMLTIDDAFDGHYSHSCFGYGSCLPRSG